MKRGLQSTRDPNIFLSLLNGVSCCNRNCLLAWTPAFFATVAVICGFAANTYCETLQIPQENGDLTLFVGVFSYRTKDSFEFNGETWVYTTCRSYKYLDRELGFDYDIDAKTRTTMAFAIMSAIIGGLATFFCYLLPCMGSPPEARWKLLGNVFILTCLLQGLSLFIQASSLCDNNPVMQYLEVNRPVIRETFGDGCEWGPGHKLNITSVVFWFVAGLSMKFIPAPQKSRSEEPQMQTVTYQQNPDGTVTETNVTVVKGKAVGDHQAGDVEQPIDEGKQ